jgi:hypothetical protein
LNNLLTYNSFGSAKLILAAGTPRLFVRIYDDMGGVTVFHIKNTVQVTINQVLMENTLNSLMSGDSSPAFVVCLQTGSIDQIS